MARIRAGGLCNASKTARLTSKASGPVQTCNRPRQNRIPGPGGLTEIAYPHQRGGVSARAGIRTNRRLAGGRGRAMYGRRFGWSIEPCRAGEGRAVIVRAIAKDAGAYWRSGGFVSAKNSPSTLFQPIEHIVKWLEHMQKNSWTKPVVCQRCTDAPKPGANVSRSA